MKDLGKATYILEVKIFRDCSKKFLTLSQEFYIKNIFKRFNMTDCKLKDIPITKGQFLSLNMCPKTPQEKERMVGVPCTNVIGSLMYVMMCTSLDISYAIGLVSIYQSNPSQSIVMLLKGFWHISKALQIIFYAIKKVICDLLDIQMPTRVAISMSTNQPRDMHYY